MIDIQIETNLKIDEFIAVLWDSGLAKRRPMDQPDLLERMLANSNLVITARHENKLIGMLRALSDFNYRTFIADLAVNRDFQNQGIGRGLINKARIHSPGARLFLFSAEDAEGFYQKIGFQRHQRCYQLNSDSLLL